MMMEHQKILNNKELQNKWNSCIMNTCYAYRTLDRFKEVIDNLHEVVIQFLDNLMIVFKPIKDSLTLVFEEFRDFIDKQEDFILYLKDYPQVYQHKVDNLKINTKGFPRPIIHCARSRC